MVIDALLQDENGQVLGKIVAIEKTFRSGSKGYHGQDKLEINGKRYQVQVQLVEIGSRPRTEGILLGNDDGTTGRASERMPKTLPSRIPRSLAALADREERARMLDSPDFRSLKVYVDRIRSDRASYMPGKHVPHFDPCDGGTKAKVLFLMQSPGPAAIETGFISCNNPDPTAENMCLLLDNAGIRRDDIIIWNIVPWYLDHDEGGQLRAPTPGEIAEAAVYLPDLFSLLGNLKAIVLVGRRAQESESRLPSVAGVTVFRANHPSPQNVNTRPGELRRIQKDFDRVAEFISQ